MSNLTDTLLFIETQASTEDIDRIWDSIKARRKILSRVRAAAVERGAEVTLAGLSPKYLNGLSGKVTKIEGERCQVELDTESTNTLRWTRQTRFFVEANAEHYTVRGIPLGCAVVQGVAA